MKPTLLGEVIASLDLDDKLFFGAIEVSNINADCMLSAELLVASLSITEQLP